MMHYKRVSFYESALIGVNAVGIGELYLQYRQWRSYFSNEMPPALSGKLKEEEFRNIQAYGRDKRVFAICRDIKDILFSNVSILTKLPSRVYKWIARCTPVEVGSFAHCCAYSIVVDVVSTLISLPFDYYHQFVVEEKHGFNKMTRKEFLMDEVKMICLRVFLMHPILTGLILQVVQRFGKRFPLYLFLGSTAIAFSFTFIYPTLIQPLFNTYTAIPEDSTLYGKILSLAKSHKFPLKKLYQVDGSRRSGHSNAYFYGFGSNKRIVLYDTLIKQMEGDDDLVLSLLCHELGHWKNNHTILLLSIGIVQMFCISFGARYVIFNNGIYKEFGFTDVNPFIGFEIFLSVVVEPLVQLLSYGVSLLSRRLEFQADRFAVESGFGPSLRKALIITQMENKADLTPDSLYAALKYTHPPLNERIAAIDAEIKKGKAKLSVELKESKKTS
ncbi:CAAX prenyl protease 1 [Trypanosoma grayi]|uniref:CAAX prenyl protease 1 n=1 Tax=Trypanosoma grayi TaxID=71804 RepID=UPI0004F4AE65|nr:CAAX prenyl protease 1 [Trypanosoma grayi]KEG14953.1 CAAX prenyl protease 1 [Trypanosoma grayi]